MLPPVRALYDAAARTSGGMSVRAPLFTLRELRRLPFAPHSVYNVVIGKTSLAVELVHSSELLMK